MSVVSEMYAWGATDLSRGKSNILKKVFYHKKNEKLLKFSTESDLIRFCLR